MHLLLIYRNFVEEKLLFKFYETTLQRVDQKNRDLRFINF